MPYGDLGSEMSGLLSADMSQAPDPFDWLRAKVGPSWLEQATDQTRKDIANYQSGGAPALMADTGVTQDLASGFGGTTKSVRAPGIRAYHGSPHNFDRFDMSQIGKGEGAQVFGHGLYFAENPEVASNYRWGLARYPSRSELSAINDLMPAKYQGSLDNARRAVNEIGKAVQYGNIQTPAEYLGAYDVGRGMGPAYKKAAEIVSNTGKTYEVNIRATPDQFINWDASFWDQPENIQRALLQQDKRFFLGGPHPVGATGGQVLKKPDVTAALGEMGVPGIRYLDEGSRGIPDLDTLRSNIANSQRRLAEWQKSKHSADVRTAQVDQLQKDIERLQSKLTQAEEAKPTSNYVLFRDDIIDILKKYGIAGALASSVLTQGQQEYQ